METEDKLYNENQTNKNIESINSNDNNMHNNTLDINTNIKNININNNNKNYNKCDNIKLDNKYIIKDFIKKNDLAEKLKKKRFTFGVTFIVMFNFLFYLFFTFRMYEISNFSLSEYPIKYKMQYYRMLTHNFIHLNFIHYAFSSYLFTLKISSLEKRIGTFIFFSFFNIIIYANSFVYIFLIKFTKIIINDALTIKYNEFDFSATVGISGIMFSMYYLNYAYDKQQKINFNNIEFNKKSIILFSIIIFQILNLHTSFYGNISGLFACIIIVKLSFLKILFPSIKVIKFLEENMFKRIVNYLVNNYNYVSIDLLSQNEVLDVLNLKIYN